MSLLTASITKNDYILAVIYFAFLKNILEQTRRSAIPNLDLTEKIEKVVVTDDKF